MFIFSHYAGNRLLTILTNILYQTTLSNMETCYKVMRGVRAVWVLVKYRFTE